MKIGIGARRAVEGRLAELFGAAAAAAAANNAASPQMAKSLAYVDVSFKAFLLGYGASRIAAGEMTPGRWFAFWSATQAVTPLIPQLAASVFSYFTALPALAILLSVLQLRTVAPPPDDEAEDLAQPPQPAAAGGAVVLHGVGFAYAANPDAAILACCCCRFDPGAKVAVMGRSGCGKSTLLKLLGRVYSPTVGVITVGGVGLNELDLASLIASVDQEAITHSTQPTRCNPLAQRNKSRPARGLQTIDAAADLAGASVRPVDIRKHPGVAPRRVGRRGVRGGGRGGGGPEPGPARRGDAGGQARPPPERRAAAAGGPGTRSAERRPDSDSGRAGQQPGPGDGGGAGRLRGAPDPPGRRPCDGVFLVPQPRLLQGV